MADDDLSQEDLERVVKEWMKESAEEKQRIISSRNSFMDFLEKAGLFWLFRKIGDIIDWILKIF